MTIRIAGRETVSMNNGDGCRYVLFLQGCAHHCSGCQNPDTWDFEGGAEYDIETLAKEISDPLQKYPYDGITLSGGDPFYQQEACTELLKRLSDVNVWCYTGFLYEDIQETELAKLCDVIVDGEYIEKLHVDGKLYGSSNQRIIRKCRKK